MKIKKSQKNLKANNSGYSDGGASHTKKALKSYTPSHFSAKSDVDANLKTLRERAYDLAINTPVGAAAISTMTTGTISNGLKLFPRINAAALGLTPEESRQWCKKTKIEFEFWANSVLCDFYRRNNFFELQNIAFVSYLADGDCFALFRRRVPTNNFPYSLRLQLIEAGRVSNPNNGVGFSPVEIQGTKQGNRIINGIEITREGTIEAVWVCNRIYNEPMSLDYTLNWQRVKWAGEKTGIRNILHVCHDTRTEQFRGVPFLSPIIETLKNINRYAEAELTSAIIKSYFSIFFTQSASTSFGLSEIVPDANSKPVVDVSEYRLGPGTMSALPMGVDVKSIDANNAQSTFESFVTQFLQQIGAALNLPYELLLKKFQSSYSASRAALLQANDEFRSRRTWFVNDFCQPIYENFLAEAVALGRIDAPGFFSDPTKRAMWSKAEWYAEGTHLLDVVKELEGAAKRIELGISSYEKEAAELCGVDFYENLESLELQRKLIVARI